jgi:hypothetical protein
LLKLLEYRSNQTENSPVQIEKMVKTNKNRRTKKRGGGLSDVLPTTDWARWQPYSAAYQWSSNSSAPAPLANGGLYTNPQSTGVWASAPFPATQHAFALEAAKTSGLPEVAYHQRPNDNFGTSYSPVMYSPLSPNHTSASGPTGPIVKGGYLRVKKGKKGNKSSKRNNKTKKYRRKN